MKSGEGALTPLVFGLGEGGDDDDRMISRQPKDKLKVSGYAERLHLE
jgi:hypothetical protein